MSSVYRWTLLFHSSSTPFPVWRTRKNTATPAAQQRLTVSPHMWQDTGQTSDMARRRAAMKLFLSPLGWSDACDQLARNRSKPWAEHPHTLTYLLSLNSARCSGRPTTSYRPVFLALHVFLRNQNRGRWGAASTLVTGPTSIICADWPAAARM